MTASQAQPLRDLLQADLQSGHDLTEVPDQLQSLAVETRTIRVRIVTSRFQSHARVSVPDVLPAILLSTVLRPDLEPDTEEDLRNRFRCVLTISLHLRRYIRVREISSYMTGLLTSGRDTIIAMDIE